MRKLLFCVATLAALPVGANATTVIFFDDFAAEVANASGTVATTNFTGLVNWTITDGAVDLFTNGGFGLPCGSAGCLDLDGSTSNAVTMNTNSAFAFVAGSIYDIAINISGKNGSNAETLSFGLTGTTLSRTFTMPTGDTAARIETLSFTAASDFSASLFIDHFGGDNRGILLDSVTVSLDAAPVPLPASLPLLAAAGGALALIRRRRA